MRWLGVEQFALELRIAWNNLCEEDIVTTWREKKGTRKKERERKERERKNIVELFVPIKRMSKKEKEPKPGVIPLETIPDLMGD